MSTATEAAPAPGEKTVDLATRLVGQPYVGRHRRRRPSPVHAPVSDLLTTTEDAK